MSYSTKHYGIGDPNCPICHGIGYVRLNVPDDHPQFGKAIDCECRQAQADADRREYLRRIGGLSALTDKTLETFNPDGVGLQEKDRANLRRVYERVSAYTTNPQGWLVIKGGYGCGKTHLAAAIANTQISSGNRAMFMTAPDLLDHLRSGYRSDADELAGYTERFDEIRTIPLLILDDLGAESPTQWANERLYQILNHRYNAMLPTVVTTNQELEGLDMRLRSRIFDPDKCEILGIQAPDYRQSGSAAERGEMNGLSLYKHMTFNSFKARQDISKDESDNLKMALTTVQGFAENPRGWLVLMGDYGSGKTHLAAAAGNYLTDKGETVVLISVPDLMDYLRSAFGPNATTSYDKRFGEVKSTPILILDDLSTDAATPWVREKLNQLFNFRYNAQLPTIVTTAQAAENIDQRLIARMRDKRLSNIVAILAPAYLGDRQSKR